MTMWLRILRNLSCFAGVHRYRRRMWARVGTWSMFERVCIRCGDSPTWER